MDCSISWDSMENYWSFPHQLAEIHTDTIRCMDCQALHAHSTVTNPCKSLEMKAKKDPDS